MTFKYAILTIAALCATGCATSTPISTRPDITSLEATKGVSADKGILIVDTTGNLNCNSIQMGFYSEDKNVVSMIDYAGSKSGPAMQVVEPGKYRLISGTCNKQGFYPSSLPSLRLWFSSIEVGAGEAVYAGTLDTNRLDVKSKLEGAGAVWSALINQSTKTQSTYLTYQFMDRSEIMKLEMKNGEEVDESLAEIADRMIYRPPLSILDKQEYEAAILRAYGKTEDGKTPTKSEVDLRFKEEMKVAIQNSLLKLGEQIIQSDNQAEDVLSPGQSKT